MTARQVCKDCGSVDIATSPSRLRLRRALIDLNHPKHERAAVWVHEPTRFKNRATRRIRAPQKHVKRQTYRTARKPMRPNVAAELLVAILVVATAAVVVAVAL